jgi:hypothetical protein
MTVKMVLEILTNVHVCTTSYYGNLVYMKKYFGNEK